MSERIGAVSCTTWRIQLRSSGKDPDRFCFDKGVMGIGWSVGDLNQGHDWNDYLLLAQKAHGGQRSWRDAIGALKQISVDDLVWARRSDGVYFLGRVTGGWEYRSDPAARSADIVNIRRCDWVRIGTVSEVPGKVVSSFIPPKTLQRVTGAEVSIYSQFRYNEAARGFKYPLSSPSNDIFELLSAEDCEDLVGIYLQGKGYVLIPSSCKADTLAYEYELRNTKTGQRAVAQVKRGTRDFLDTHTLAEAADEVFLFSTAEQYRGGPKANVHCLSRSELEEFMSAHPDVLPDRIRTWVRIRDALASPSSGRT